MPLFILSALLAGAMQPLQAVFNARLGRALGSSAWGASASALISAGVLFLFGLALTQTLPRTADLGELPVWAWVGGLCGAVTLAGITAAIPQLGAASTVALVIAGQVIFSLILDRAGLFGLAPQPLTLQRVAAAALLLSGAILIR